MSEAKAAVRAMLERERRELADLLRTLTPQQWNTESLCTGWRVRDVVAHLLYETRSAGAYTADVIRSRGSFDRMNGLHVDSARHLSTDDLITAYESTITRGVGYRWAPRLSLADTMIHHQDIRRPLGLPRTVPEAHLRTLLNHPDPTLRPGPRMRGLSFQATDLDWQQGEGPPVKGPGEAIFMAIAGRTPALDDLTGTGVDILRGRLT
ncbi:maleylpyruvate isomerase family mycothiol-dependent enzyme [Nocardia huaxiensis]|uniref:Maleylpyruvate isomerase family mycothiol-dependent enzyme n=1 Tax=Nocardia huaxiensis TaxID=2755382 RepID=A0A7D6ZFK9_9NOCA|nr:maleylpyruvate isomerase family mycothiol-dependent enzyme [Nocardia huaxiensis]QLY32458.1 maleylpyruvate isomerase family mycothiol-dependent enzyme [Nocardia huaxiensis]UFS93835.1 maleylpyruvate isomerase family mycothiol-dependent enzyme [Nocardia huaxiensis]